MSSFKGSYIYAVDSKGRISLPARLRKSLSPEANESFTITRGFEKCLFVYPLDEWTRLEQNLRALSPYDPHDRLFMRRLLENATESQLDGQARITIPQQLLGYAEIRDEVRIIGTLDKIELWNPQVYDEYIALQSESYEEIAAKVMRRV
jgi:MraZ protein